MCKRDTASPKWPKKSDKVHLLAPLELLIISHDHHQQMDLKGVQIRS